LYFVSVIYVAVYVRGSITGIGHLHGSHLANAKCRVADTKGALPGYQEGYLSAWTEDNVMECSLMMAHDASHKRIVL